ncbi:O-antigen ligase family protein [Azospirillum sp. SYSU D00513]|uniref:O-antigen ligase family protein n=1 Tax=Azospirillum sp. SYSU D00513 TaxID=2812561 RepID=UPI001A969329|nr:O-antigen ligase family protein [Azospirillum sp. SYSU D00513]
MTMTMDAALRPSGWRAQIGRVALWSFWFLILALCAVGQARLLAVVFPAAALATGCVLCMQDPARFLSFTWWLWFLTPEVRRIVDHQAGWSTISTVMITPFLVGCLTWVTIIMYAPMLRYRSYVGFALVIAGLVYSYLVGILQAGIPAATFGLLNWLVPITLGMYAAFHWPIYPQIRDEVLRTFTWGLIVVGGYGLVQYFFMPAWDAYWLISVGMTNQGQPLPMQVRVFSTLNSSGPLAFLLITGIAVLPAARGVLVPLAGALALASLMLSLVRAAWLAGLVVFLYLLITMPGRHRLRLLAIMAALSIAVVPLFSIPKVGDVILARFDSLNTMEHDRSYQERQEFYGRFLVEALTNIGGAGLGAVDTATKLSNDGQLGVMAYFDSGLMRVPYELGWPGTIGYASGIAILMVGLFRRRGMPADSFARCSEAIAVTILISMVFEHTLVKVTGVSFWFFLGMALAAKNHGLAKSRAAEFRTENASAEGGR